MGKIVELVKYSKDSRLILLSELMKSKKKKYIYGAGECAKNTYELLHEYNIEIDGFCVDEEYYIENIYINNVKIYNVNNIISEDVELIIGFENRSRAISIVKELGERGIKVYYFEDLFCFRTMDYRFFIDNINNYQKAYDLLEDNLSKEIFIAHINSRIAGDYSDISQYDSKLKYGYDFEIMHIGKNEIFVDCGAFDGDTILEFFDYTAGEYNKVIAFEPDEENAQKLIKKTNEYNNIYVITKGVSNVNEVKKFYNDGSLYSNFVDTGLWGEKTRRDIYNDTDNYTSIPVCRMDDEIINEGVTVIKMDIEGSELNALQGAEEIIKTNHPKLAICIYHKSEDLFSCINYIHSIVGENVYKYYIRHHSDNITETILYAVPVE